MGTSIDILKTSYRATKASAVRERYLGSVRREYLDPMLVVRENHGFGIVKDFVDYFDPALPHQGIEPQISERRTSAPAKRHKAKIITYPVQNGLHHDYRPAA